MKKGILAALVGLLALSITALAIVDIFSEIGPADKTEGFHAKFKLEAQGDGKILVT